MCISAKTEICHFVHIMNHNSGFIIGISNSPNRAVFLFVQRPFDAAKQSVLGRALPGLLAWDIKEQGLLNAFV